jgi:hypothetical protein
MTHRDPFTIGQSEHTHTMPMTVLEFALIAHLGACDLLAEAILHAVLP